jgi:competence protein ComEC
VVERRTIFQKERKRFAVSMAFTLLFASTSWALYIRTNRELRVTFLDVGQGDSTVIESPSGKVIVIDAGNILDDGIDDQGRRVVAPYLRSRGINKIDLLVLTHPDADHIGGAETLLHEFAVDNLLENGQFRKSDSALIAPIFQACQRQKTQIRIARRGQKVDFGDGAVLNILAPTDAMMSNKENDASIVIRLDYNDHSFLFTGDAGETEEADLLAANQPLQCDVLKAGHHGSKSSTTLPFLDVVKPSRVIFSCGENNRYGHPHPDVIERVSTSGATIFRTDKHGAIVFMFDGVTLKATPTLNGKGGKE